MLSRLIEVRNIINYKIYTYYIAWINLIFPVFWYQHKYLKHKIGKKRYNRRLALQKDLAHELLYLDGV